MRKGGVHPVDLAVGRNVRLARRRRGVSQEALAELIGVSFQQVQKYEYGANRISTSRLVEIASGLDVEVGHLLSGAIGRPALSMEDDELVAAFAHALLSIPHGEVKRRLVRLAEEISISGGGRSTAASRR